jgi:pyruvate dehydrogenase E2 component (dihydrolipoamide acetyltransferase)
MFGLIQAKSRPAGLKMYTIIMPKAGQTMEEGTVLRWFKQEGERVESGEVVVEVETDKAVMEVASERPGILCRILVSEGERVPVMAELAHIEGCDEPI